MSDRVVVDTDGAWERLTADLAAHGFEARPARALVGAVSAGLAAPIRVKLTPSNGFPFTPPTVRPLDDVPLSWHRDPHGNLCLYSGTDAIGAPWLDADALVEHVTGWFRNNEAGWPDDPPLLELDAYIVLSAIPTTLVLEQDFNHGDGIGFTARSNRNTSVPVVPWDSVGPMPEGLWDRGRGVFVDLGELQTPFFNWEQLVLLLDAGDAQSWEKDIRSGRLHFLAVRYTRAGRVGHVALLVRTLGPSIDLKRMYLDRVDDESLTLRANQPAVLRKRNVTIVGVGGLGSFLADLLVRAGVRNLRLIDHEILLPGNSIRHLAGRPEWGRPKPHAVKCVLDQHRPQPNITTDTSCILDHEAAQSAFADVDLVIDAAGHAWATALLSHEAARSGTPLLITYIQRAGGVVRMDRAPLTAGETYGAEIPPSPTEPEPLIASGCGDPVSPTPPHAVVAAAAATVPVALGLLRGQHIEPTTIVRLTSQPDLDEAP